MGLSPARRLSISPGWKEARPQAVCVPVLGTSLWQRSLSKIMPRCWPGLQPCFWGADLCCPPFFFSKYGQTTCGDVICEPLGPCWGLLELVVTWQWHLCPSLSLPRGAQQRLTRLGPDCLGSSWYAISKLPSARGRERW